MKFFLNYFNFPIKMIVAPILRDSNGVALSSRNRFLTPSEYQDATSIYKVLQEVASWTEIEPINYIKSYITHHVKSEVCSVDICCAKTLENLIVLDRKALIVINASYGKTILDDNIIIDP